MPQYILTILFTCCILNTGFSQGEKTAFGKESYFGFIEIPQFIVVSRKKRTEP